MSMSLYFWCYHTCPRVKIKGGWVFHLVTRHSLTSSNNQTCNTRNTGSMYTVLGSHMTSSSSHVLEEELEA